MKKIGMGLSLLVGGVVLGLLISNLFVQPARTVAAGNDRYQDFILCTGTVAVRPDVPTDGVWLLDYRSGKLLGTVIDRNVGKIIGWAEVDLTKEFEIQPRENVHFMMTTGNITKGQSALYLAETTTGKLAVYTMGPIPGQGNGISIRRHDLLFFRAPK
jgi:hypothetical protein